MNSLFAQENNEFSPCISDEEYKIIASECSKNISKFKLGTPTKGSKPSFIWPIQASNKLHDCSFYYVSAYVDQNKTSGQIQDYNCGTNTYDGHTGTDISTWPFNFYKLDNDLVEVIAAADGVIVAKHDGEFDKNCGATNVSANYLVIRHADLSVSFYWHMKKNSVTTKQIGDAIVAGEKIGIVGSSGNASGPHLHFEVKTDFSVATSYIDPFTGTCNSLSATTWWQNQKNYVETIVVRASVHATDAVFPACPATETLNEMSDFTTPYQGAGLAPGYAKFYMFLRNEVNGLIANLKILNPDNTVFSEWTYTSTADSKTKTFGYSKKLPTTAGVYTFIITYNNTTCSSTFSIDGGGNTPANIQELEKGYVVVFPNPSNGKFTLQMDEPQNKRIEIYTLLGEKILENDILNSKMEIDLSNNKGVFIYKIIDSSTGSSVYTGKLMNQ